MRTSGKLALIAALFVAAPVLASCGAGAADQQGLVEHGSDGGAQDMDHGNSGGMEGMDMGDSGERTPVSELPEARMQGPIRMGDLVMPPGMVMTADQSMEAMEDMAAVNPEEVDYAAPRK